MTAPFKTTRRVEFCHTDAAGIMHFSSFFTFMEQAEHELLRHLGFSVVMQDEQGTISWPRVKANCEYSGAAKFEDLLDIEVRVQRLGEKSVSYAFDFLREGKKIATGSLTSVCCRIWADAPPRSIPIPGSMAEKIASLKES